MSIAAVSQNGSRLDTLTAIRDRLANDLDNASEPRDVAALALRLTDVLQQIDDLPQQNGQLSAADEIADRRATRRRARAKGPPRAARPG